MLSEEQKERKRNMDREWRKNNTEKVREYDRRNKEKHKEEIRIRRKLIDKKYYNKNKEKLRLKSKEYYQRNKVMRNKRKDINRKNKRKKDKNFCISLRLRSHLFRALDEFTSKGKLVKADCYGVDYKKIIEHLKPFPEDISKCHIDHIKPLCSFDLTNQEEVKRAFIPENHRWLLAEDNLKKGSKIID